MEEKCTNAEVDKQNMSQETSVYWRLIFTGSEAAMDPKPDYGRTSYKGHARLTDRVAVITGGDCKKRKHSSSKQCLFFEL